MSHKLTYISLGAGVQSTAMYVLSALGKQGVPRADFAVFADTGDEPRHVYEQLEKLEDWGEQHGGPPIERVSAGVLSEEIVSHKFVAIPVYLKAPDGKLSILRRQCTREYKITPIMKLVRVKLGLKPRQRNSCRVRAMIGFSCDEASRMKDSREHWIDNIYPLIDAGLYRNNCIQVVEDAGLGTPRKSACVYCPYQSDHRWAEMKRDNPDEFEKACKLDELIRTKTRAVKDEAFVHKSGVPLRDVKFGDFQSLWDDECEGHCGV